MDRSSENRDIARRLEELAALLDEQGANPFRARAYRRAGGTVAALVEPVSDLLREGDLDALEALPGIGPSIARSIQGLVLHGRLPMLERLRGHADPVALFRSVAGVGPTLAERLHHELGVDTLEELEMAAHDGRLAALPGFGPRRVAAIQDALAQRLARVRTALAVRPADQPAVSELLSVDREYRDKAERGELQTIAPRRFNPTRASWLPVLHAQRGSRHYTALFSNTARAHQLHRTDDWVVLYYDGPGGERQYTVITSERGALRGHRIVRGREAECEQFEQQPHTANADAHRTPARVPASNQLARGQ